MRINTVLTWGLTAALAIGAMVPTLADPGKGKFEYEKNDSKGSVRVRIVAGQDADDDLRAYQQWYGYQVRGYDNVDDETGERVSSLLHIVTDVSRDRVVVNDRDNHQHAFIITSRTKLVFQQLTRSWTPPGQRNRPFDRSGADLASRLRPGDLVIVSGYLSDRGMTASNVRVVGHAWGWGDDDNDTWDRPSCYDGTRAWGEVRVVDTRLGRIEVSANVGYRALYTRRAEIIADGRTQSLSYLRRGDRVVFYFTGRDSTSVEVYRIVVLKSSDRYPDSDRPCWTDPNYDKQNGDWDHPSDTPVIDGRLQYISTNVLFNKIVLRSNSGRDVTIRFSKSTEAIDRDGDRISILNLRDGDYLRIYYYEIGGIYFAQRIEVR